MRRRGRPADLPVELVESASIRAHPILHQLGEGQTGLGQDPRERAGGVAERETQRLTTTVEFNQPSDNRLATKGGVEYEFSKRIAVRTGYNLNADEFKWSAGAGLYPNFGTTRGSFDYAFTDGEFLGSVHRLSLGVRF